jgi:hypothetical protein
MIVLAVPRRRCIPPLEKLHKRTPQDQPRPVGHAHCVEHAGIGELPNTRGATPNYPAGFSWQDTLSELVHKVFHCRTSWLLHLSGTMLE